MQQHHNTGRRTGRTDWAGLLRLYLFFFYFSGLCHILLQLAGNTVFIGLRQAIVMSLLWLVPVLLLPSRTRSIAALIGVVLWACSLVSLGYFCIYHQEFSQSVLFVMFESNPAESSEYIGHYFRWWMLPVLLAHTLVALWLWWRLRPVRLGSRRAWIASVLILVVLFAGPLFKSLALKHESWGDAVEKLQMKMEPAVPWQIVIGYLHYRAQLANMEALLELNAQLPPLAGLTDANAGKPGTLVLVIGESTNRQRMSLYGYARPTTPRLDAMKDQLQVFRNVVTSRPYTIEALEQVLTFADQEHPDLYLSKPSLMNLMKQAGYKTYWVTNQQTITKRNTMLTTFSKQTDRQYYLNHTRAQNSREYDDNVLAPFAEILQDPAPRKFIVVHLLGTHMKYNYRYPESYAHFTGRDHVPEVLDDRQAEVYNSYDNAVLFNDMVVSSLIDSLAKQRDHAMLVYFSDHGEDVYDTPPHNILGRNEGQPTLAMYTVPFITWFSEAWKAEHDTDFSAMLDRPYSNARFIHTWADLAGLRFEGYDAASSLVSPGYRELPLWIGDPSKPLQQLKFPIVR